MLYFLKYRKARKSKGYKNKLKKNNAFLAKCAVCNINKLRFFKKEEASRISSKLRIRAPFKHLMILDYILI